MKKLITAHASIALTLLCTLVFITLLVIKSLHNYTFAYSTPTAQASENIVSQAEYDTLNVDVYQVSHHDGEYWHAYNTKAETVVFTLENVDDESIALGDVVVITLDDNGENPLVYHTTLEGELVD